MANQKSPPKKSLYYYSGPIYRFDQYVGDFKGKTWAVSSKKAKQNIAFQFGMQQGLEPTSIGNIRLDKDPELLYKAG